MSKELSKAYEPQNYEDEIYKGWEESNSFNPDNLALEKGADYFSVSMPPPNVTGVLHLGHALENSIMDIEVRYQRMCGKKTLLVPGTDHAAVATQAKVEKILVSEGVKNPRQELGREKLLEKIREYAEDSKATIIKQVKKLGTSADWSRLAYTFDEARSLAVNEVFIRMYKDGLIYKGYRTVNWSVKGQSTCSDDELEYREEKAKLYWLKYGPFVLATSRPETKLGDTAVAVHPDDERYKDMIGKKYMIPGVLGEFEITVVADEAVDPSFGSGAIKVTPAHSMIDYEIAQRHNLPMKKIIGEDGRMMANCGKYAGLTTKEAREAIVADMEKLGLIDHIDEDYIHNIATSDRFGDVVEVIPMQQWFIDVNKKIPSRDKSLKELMREAVTVGHNGDANKKIIITPDRFNNQYFHWIDNLRDWCISRQIWWGHRIPVWYKGDEIYCGIEAPAGEGWEQDPDTLDTWFSSGLWTFSTLGWPNQTKDLQAYHPTSWMQMGYEILFFWMARMILMSTYALDDIPFKSVYIHGILRDKEGRKFSKSLGNGIDPIEVIEKYGADALRLSLVIGIAPGSDSRFYEEKVESARNFVNKLWNVARYILQTTNKEENQREEKIESENLTLADRWILGEMRDLIGNYKDDLDNYRVSQAGERLKEFTWTVLADWYLETSKFEDSEIKSVILKMVLVDLLKLWHPFIPFVTEVVWREINSSKMLIVERLPEAERYSTILSQVRIDEKFNFSKIANIITAIRNARSENKVEPAKKIKAVIYAGAETELIKSQEVLIRGLRTGIEDLEIKDKGEKITDAIYVVVDGIEIYLIGAVDAEKEKIRIEKGVANLQKLITVTKAKLANKEFVDKAPNDVVKKEKEKLEKYQKDLKKLEEKR